MGSGMGDKLGGMIKDASQGQFSNKQAINSDGGTVGDLRGAGMTDDQLDQLGIKRSSPSDLQQGLGQGVAQAGVASMQQPQNRGGMPQMPQVQQPGNITLSDPSYLAQAAQQWNKNKFYGGN